MRHARGSVCWFAALATLASAMVTGASSGTVELMSTLFGHTQDVNVVTFSPDGSILATGSWDETLRLWTDEGVRSLLGHRGSVQSVVFSPDGRTLASGSGDRTVKLWDVDSGKEIATLTGHVGGVSSVAFSPDGDTLASGALDHAIKIWGLVAGTHWEARATLVGHTHGVRAVAFSPDGSVLASGSQDNTIRIWDVATGSEIRSMGEEGHGFYAAVAFSPDGQALASGNADGSITLWDVNTGEAIRTIVRQGPRNPSGHTASALSVAFFPDGSILASGSQDSTVKLWEVATGNFLFTLSGHTNTVRSVSFSPDRAQLASGSVDATVKLWDVQAIALEQHAITNIRFSPPSPATLGFNDRVTFTFDYTTTEPGGVYIWGTPFTGGSQSGGLAQHGSVLHPTGQGSLSGWFTIRFGAKTVDQVRFQMVDADRNVLYETMVNVDYAFGEAADSVEPTGRVALVSADPPLGSDLSMAEGVTFTVVVDYELAGVEGGDVVASLELGCGTGVQIGSREVAAGAGVTSIVGRINIDRARQFLEDRPNYEGILYLSVRIGYWHEPGHRRILHRDSLLGPYYVEGDEAAHVDPLSGTSWILAGMAGQTIVPGMSITLNFKDGQLGGADGCNRYWGPYTVRGSSLRIVAGLAGTAMACPEDTMALAGAYTMMLGQVRAFTLLSENLLVLQDGSGESLAIFSPA